MKHFSDSSRISLSHGSIILSSLLEHASISSPGPTLKKNTDAFVILSLYPETHTYTQILYLLYIQNTVSCNISKYTLQCVCTLLREKTKVKPQKDACPNNEPFLRQFTCHIWPINSTFLCNSRKDRTSKVHAHASHTFSGQHRMKARVVTKGWRHLFLSAVGALLITNARRYHGKGLKQTSPSALISPFSFFSAFLSSFFMLQG